MSSILRSLRNFDYRVWFIGAFVSNVGTWMQTTAQSWVVLTELTDGDAVAMGISITLQFAPILLLAPLTGWVSDHFDRRTLLIISQIALGMLALGAGVLLLTDVMTLEMMYVFSAAIGIVTAFDNPPRQMYVADLVSGHETPNALALHSASFNVARLGGPALAGLLIVLVGSGWVFVVNALSFVATLISLGIVRRRTRPQRQGDRFWAMLAGGFTYVARRTDLILMFAMIFTVTTFGMNFAIYASTMAIEFGTGADGYGLLTSLFGGGALAGALFCARQTRARFDIVILGCLVVALASALAVLAPTFWLLGAAMIVIGAGMMLVLVTSNSYVQTTASPALRGRVLALHIALVQGGMPIGALTLGWVVSAFNPRAAIAVAAMAALLGAGIGIVWRVAAAKRGVAVDAPLAFMGSAATSRTAPSASYTAEQT
jgi:MFS family permease